MKNQNLDAEKLYLASSNEKNENAQAILELSAEEEKYPFILQYTPNEKRNVISELERIGCVIERHMEFAYCVVVSMSMSQLEAMKIVDGVESVEKDYDYKVLSENTEDDGAISNAIDQESKNTKEAKIKIAVFDTGVSEASRIIIEEAVNFVDVPEGLSDLHGHGTQMAGIISAISKDTETQKAAPHIYSVIVADHRGFAKTSSIMAGLDWAINNEVKIINMSFGDYHKSYLLEEMINRAARHGIIVVGAVGNDGGFENEQCLLYPAAFDGVLSVGAGSGRIAEKYSNGGTAADCLAPGMQNTVDVNGNKVSVIGTSAAAAYVAGTLLKTWCSAPENNAQEVITSVKAALSGNEEISGSTATDIDNVNLLTDMENDGMMNAETASATLYTGGGTALSVSDDSCCSNDMSSAISLSFFSWQTGYITCPGNEVWYKFTTNVTSPHPNGSLGWYAVQTQGSLDTIGTLYDSYGNQIGYNDDADNGLNFKISAQLAYGKTYYIRVKAYHNSIGSFSIKVDYSIDDHGNSQDTATNIGDVYYADKSFSGSLHSRGDVDYYTFTSARNCVMEIYTEGGTDTYGRLYCASGSLLYADNNSNGNGNFKITAHLEGNTRYYIAVSHNSATGYGDYTLRFKFVSDWMEAVVGQYNIALWKNADTPNATSTDYTEISRAFITADAASEYATRIIEDYPSHKATIGNAIAQSIYSELVNALKDTVIDAFFPIYGDVISLSTNIAKVIYDNMQPENNIKQSYITLWNLLQEVDAYIIAINSQKKTLANTYSDKLEYIAHGPAWTFYGADYQRGNFSTICLKNS